MSNYTSSADLLDDILFRCGEPTDGTSDFNDAAIRYLNRAYQALWMGATELDPTIPNTLWWWLRAASPGTLTLKPIIETGTVTVTNNSTGITFTDAPAASVAGYHFQVDDHQDIFRISAHTAASASATLDSVYTGTGAAGKGYRLMKLEYTLATDLLSLIAPLRAYQDGRYEIGGMTARELDDRWPLPQVTTGVPKAFAMLAEQTIRFSHAGGADGSEDLIRVDYDYFAAPADLADNSTEPLVPRQYRRILSDFATGWLLTDKNDDRAQGAFSAARAGLQAMFRENRLRLSTMSREFGRIYTRADRHGKSARVLRTESGHILG
jgi:hypothetical protein